MSATSPPSELSARPLIDYLDDRRAPIQVSHEIGELVRADPATARRAVMSWSNSQLDASLHSLPLRAFFFHALRKIAVLSETGTLERVAIEPFLSELIAEMNLYVEAEESSAWRQQLSRLWLEDAALSKVVDLLHSGRSAEEMGAQSSESPAAGEAETREGAEGDGPDAAEDTEPTTDTDPTTEAKTSRVARQETAPTPRKRSPSVAQKVMARERSQARDFDAEMVSLGLERLSLLTKRVEAAADAAERPEGATLVAAVNAASSNQEFRQHLDRLKAAGLTDLAFEDLLQKLTDALPNWSVASNDLQTVDSPSLDAVRSAVRFNQTSRSDATLLPKVVRRAVRHLNSGSLGRAVTVMALLEQLFADAEVGQSTRENLLQSEGEAIDIHTVIELAKRAENQMALRRVLSSFPQTRLEGLVETLHAESDRRRRYQLLSLIRIYGDGARSIIARPVLDEAAAFGETAPWYVVRNALFLLRRIPPGKAEVLDAEIDAVGSMATLTRPAPILREALLYLGAAEGERAGEHLSRCLLDLLRAGLRRDLDAKSRDTVAQLQILTLSQLLRRPEPASRLVAFDFLLKGRRWQPAYTSLLEGFAQTHASLADDPESLELTLGALRDYAKGARWSGFLGGRSAGELAEERVRAIVGTLASTPTPEVDLALAQVVESARTDVTRKKARTVREQLKELTLTPQTEAKFSGDLELFGLPGLLQILETQQSSGLLQLTNTETRTWAKLLFFEGKLVETVFGKRTGTSAFFQLLQHPFPCDFEFDADDEAKRPLNEPRPLTPTLLEALRRSDELSQMRAALPSSLLVEPGTNPPTPPAGEEDGSLLHQLWSLAKRRTSIETLEVQAEVDAWRVRRVVAHWHATRALRLTP